MWPSQNIWNLRIIRLHCIIGLTKSLIEHFRHTSNWWNEERIWWNGWKVQSSMHAKPRTRLRGLLSCGLFLCSNVGHVVFQLENIPNGKKDYKGHTTGLDSCQRYIPSFKFPKKRVMIWGISLKKAWWTFLEMTNLIFCFWSGWFFFTFHSIENLKFRKSLSES